jgi:hypothetical protein
MYSAVHCFQPLVLSMTPGACSGGQQNAASQLRKTVDWPKGRRGGVPGLQWRKALLFLMRASKISWPRAVMLRGAPSIRTTSDRMATKGVAGDVKNKPPSINPKGDPYSTIPSQDFICATPIHNSVIVVTT